MLSESQLGFCLTLKASCVFPVQNIAGFQELVMPVLYLIHRRYVFLLPSTVFTLHCNIMLLLCRPLDTIISSHEMKEWVRHKLFELLNVVIYEGLPRHSVLELCVFYFVFLYFIFLQLSYRKQCVLPGFS
jgi:hypothetical protein